MNDKPQRARSIIKYPLLHPPPSLFLPPPFLPPCEHLIHLLEPITNFFFFLSPLSTRLSMQVFRTDFITAMKLPDSAQLGPDDFYVLSDPWRLEWEKGVQVPANLEAIPEPVVR